jgi:hypothetical protein
MNQEETKVGTGRAGSLKLAELPDEMQDLMREFDMDGSGGINVHELYVMVQAYKDSKRQQRLLKVVLAIVLFALVMSSASTFGVSYAAVELAKDTQPNANGVIVLSDAGHWGENRPALSPELTITDGIETSEDGIRRLLSRRLPDNVTEDGLDNLTEEDGLALDWEPVITITESRVTEACHLFHQGAASNLVITVDDQDFRVSPTRFHHSCMTASGSYDGGVWSLLCYGDNEVCDVSVNMQQSQPDRRLERALMGKVSMHNMNYYLVNKMTSQGRLATPPARDSRGRPDMSGGDPMAQTGLDRRSNMNNLGSAARVEARSEASELASSAR